MLRRIIQIVIALAIILVAVLLMFTLIKTAPKAVKTPKEQIAPSVEYVTANRETIPLKLTSQGEVSTARQATLSAEVTGKIISVSPKYQVGGTFNEGEVILEIESTDYRAALSRAKSVYRDALLALELEKSRADQAIRDWKKLGQGRPASDLLLRKPQLASAEASVEAGKADLSLAERNLERTKIRAPYDCQIEKKLTDLGATVTMGAGITSIFSISELEIRIPLSLEDAQYLKKEQGTHTGSFTAEATMGSQTSRWQGVISRSENKVDSATRSVYVVGTFRDTPPPEIGLFVDVILEGKSLSNVIKLPRISLKDNNQVLIISPENTLEFRDISIIRTTENDIFVDSGIEDGERVCTTILSTPLNGMSVTTEPLTKAE